MSQLDNTLYIDLILIFWLWSHFIGVVYILWIDILSNWGILLKYFWLNFICDLKLFIVGYLLLQGNFGNKTIRLQLLDKNFKVKK
jgi:hypothetical protein